jgi:hypothetical protein
LAWTEILLFMLPCDPGMTGMYHYAQVLFKMGSLELSALAGLQPGFSSLSLE